MNIKKIENCKIIDINKGEVFSRFQETGKEEFLIKISSTDCFNAVELSTGFPVYIDDNEYVKPVIAELVIK